MAEFTQQQFDQMIDKVRDGDPVAAELLIREFEPQIRRLVRLRMTSPSLRRAFDSTDICQSIFANFFIRVSMGEFEFKGPEQLIALLSTMARNKIINQARYVSSRQPKGQSRILYGDWESSFAVPGSEQTPSQQIIGLELIDKFKKLLSSDDRTIAEYRRNGKTWQEIGVELNESAEAIRKRFSRACNMALAELGLNIE